MSVLPPPYTPTPDPSCIASSSEPRPALPLTPLPSYTASPILSPTLATPFGKTSPPQSTPFASTHTHTGTAHAAHSAFATLAVALLGTTLADVLYLAMVNLLGVLLTAIQLPMAVLLWRSRTSQQEAEETEGRPIGRGGAKNVDWLRWFTQKMWDWHDRLEEAELETPSSRARHTG
ncbi:hypothetical protein PSEUBRA_002446 [Kalmanozyma brasiliensis GHG001]|uniref:uncharacterized protein n=1 Tax=Kalmanozyma brasiliensis (strain GHG001) TaxID=1365824 RepID=UPI001CE97713|nr:uncharacterized protein PSEUBRA_002446 [Kalmanozyma brasiliensis GHG001]KAF6767086.1 hypothetical protein PSEUBRA_002446 [Kalmanozyma brasiliensis GHG001]